jgi:hypothetical protein
MLELSFMISFSKWVLNEKLILELKLGSWLFGNLCE